MSPSKKQRVECALIAQHKFNMAALCAELERTVGMASYLKYYPFDQYDPDEDFFTCDETGRVNKGALVLYNYLSDHGASLNYLPPPPAGTYGTPDEMEAQHTEDREERRWAAEERAFYEK